MVGRRPPRVAPARRRGDPHRPCARGRARAPQRADRRQRRRQPGCARRDAGRGLADAGHGPAVPGRRRRAAALPRPPGAERRSGARRAAGALRPCPAPAGALLRAGRFDPSWLGGLERQAAAAGVAIAAARRQTVRGLAPPGSSRRTAFRRPSSRWPDRSRTGWPSCPRSRSRSASPRRWPNAGGRTPRPGSTAIGPHRSDLVVHERLGPPRRRLLDRAAEGAAREPGAGRGASARRAGRTAADPSARRGGGAPRRRAAGRAVRSPGRARRPGLADRHRCRHLRAARRARPVLPRRECDLAAP